MTTSDIFQRMIGALNQASIPFMLTGSFASSYHGSPRATQDIDLVIAPTADQIRTFVRSLPQAEFYVDEDAALDAQRRRGQFNVIDFATGWKIDLIVRKSRPFSITEFERRTVVEFLGMKLAIAGAEDIVIAKLEWAKQDESQRQVDDAASVLTIRAAELDLEYIRRWVRDLELEPQWRKACVAAGLAP